MSTQLCKRNIMGRKGKQFCVINIVGRNIFINNHSLLNTKKVPEKEPGIEVDEQAMSRNQRNQESDYLYNDMSFGHYGSQYNQGYYLGFL